MNNTALKLETGWNAKLEFGLKPRPDKTVLAYRHQRGPLAIQRPFYPESEVCHLYLLHPPGGLVGGDQLSINATVASKAAGLVTTPGATKFYRSSGARACQYQTMQVEADATLEWLPQENIFFPGGNNLLSTEIRLLDNAQFIGWEIQCFGRPANKEPFDTGKVNLELKVFRDQHPLLLEKFSLTETTDLDAISGLRGLPVLATLIATGVNSDLLESLQDQLSVAQPSQLGFTLLEDVLVCRYLGDSTEAARKLFIAVWTKIRPENLGREACPPRIWST